MLSQINKGRICKDRVLQFLLKEAEKDSAVATMVMPLLERISLTIVHKDKAALIKAMMKLKCLYPELATPLVAKAIPIKQVTKRAS